MRICPPDALCEFVDADWQAGLPDGFSQADFSETYQTRLPGMSALLRSDGRFECFEPSHAIHSVSPRRHWLQCGNGEIVNVMIYNLDAREVEDEVLMLRTE